MFSINMKWKINEDAKKDNILGIKDKYDNDKNRNKINLIVGAYRNEKGESVILDSVLEARKGMKIDNYEYLPIRGNNKFIRSALKLLYGNTLTQKIASIQTLSGTGACYIAAKFLKKLYFNNNEGIIYLPNKTWSNHYNIVEECGLKYESYRYYNKKGLDMEGLIRDIEDAENKSVFLFHVCAHNPTGVDPTRKEWNRISKVVKEKEHIVLFDCAYQGFATANMEEDSYCIRKFMEDDNIFMIAQSFSKNVGMYSERVGTLSITTSSMKEKNLVEGHLKNIARAIYSNPPSYGSRIVEKLLNDNELRNIWLEDCKKMVSRIKESRENLKKKLEDLGSKYDWDFLVKQKGMFAYFELGEEKVERLKNEFHIYLAMDGRISICGISDKNIDYLAKCLHEITK